MAPFQCRPNTAECTKLSPIM